MHSAMSIVISTSSEHSSLLGIAVDEVRVVTFTAALSFSDVPKSMIVIGAAVIGFELGSAYARLGTKVTVVAYLDTIPPGRTPRSNRPFGKLSRSSGLSSSLVRPCKRSRARRRPTG